MGRRLVILSAAALLGALSAWPLRPYRQAWFTRQPPQRVLVLGGDVDREKAGLQLGRRLALPVVVSGGSNPEYAHWLMDREGLSQSRVRLDYRAKDTLGNFTSLVDDLKREGVQHVLLVTSRDHLPRAIVVGRLVAGSRGIRLTAVPVACAPRCLEESLGKQVGDGLRALAWVLTGRDLKPWARMSWGRWLSGGTGPADPGPAGLDPGGPDRAGR
jgi:uncharacterized SAM-binding protein YcdF (DUF218 family)